MTNRDVVKKAVAYIEQNLHNDITVLNVAQEVCYSLYHFMRLFRHITGHSVQSYIQKRRLTQSLELLTHSSERITSIAYTYQFGSPEAYSRAFRKHFYVSPSAVRKGSIPLTSLPLVLPISEAALFLHAHHKVIAPTEVVLPEIMLVGTAFFAPDDDMPQDLSKEWMQFANEAKRVTQKIMPEQYYQVQYWSGEQILDGIFFFLGVEVSKVPQNIPHLVIKQIPEGRYLHFIHRGYANKVGETYNFIYNQYLPDTECQLKQPFNFERYSENYKGPYNEDSESDIFIPID